MAVRGRDDSGQAFPVYIAVIAGLLFLAFAYFVVGAATTLRGGAQTAADAAALAAAQDARDQLRTEWLSVIGDPAQWDPILRGRGYLDGPACRRAADLADRNGAALAASGGCEPLATGDEGFRVTVRTTGTVGRSLVPGTESQRAEASAEAVIEPLCRFDPPEPTAPPTESTAPPTEPGGPDQPEDPGPEEPEVVTGLTCGGEEWEIDPADPVLPGASDLFTVRLTD
ncbi:pilus assembly protein TadG-related protein [Streptomyces sp. NPDC092359]|uniref:pilus assembly protein TadG-related protein n=1 Tax=Streptomyces sp. NPDC092359 TaxID=3366014 RepID=UPI003812A4F7